MAPRVPTLDKYMALRAEQEKTLAQHKMFQQGLQKKQDTLNQRKGDLDIADRTMKAFDSKIPKSARQFLLNQTAQSLGIDTKADGYKQSAAMILGLDPQSSQLLRTQFSSTIEGAEPGTISAQAKAVLSGQFPIHQMLDQVDFTGGMGDDMLAGGEKGDQLQGGTSSKAKTAQPFQGGPGSVQSFEGQRTIPAAAQQASPMLVGALGLDSSKRYRNNDLWTNGFRTPMDPKEQEKLAESITTRTVGLTSTISEAANMTALFEGKPEVLGPVGAAARTIGGTMSQIQGFLNIVKPGTSIEAPTPEINSLANRVGIDIAKRHKIQVTGESAHRIQSMVLGLAYRMAVANDIPGNRLTNGIIQQNLEQLGQSSDPVAFKAVLRDTINSTTREFNDHVRRTTGVDGVTVLARQASNDDILRMAQSGDILPISMAQALRDEAVNRQQGKPSAQVEPASPTMDEEEGTLGGLEMQDKERKIAKTEQDMQLDKERNDRGISAEKRAEGREDRMTAAQERQGKIAEESLQFQRTEAGIDNARADRAQERADVREDRLADTSAQSQQLAQDKFAYEQTQDTKQADERQRQHMAQMWMTFAKMISDIGSGGGAVGGGGGGGGGGGQDAGAFRLTPLNPRPLPRPAGG